jgi:hypothetical protein
VHRKQEIRTKFCPKNEKRRKHGIFRYRMLKNEAKFKKMVCGFLKTIYLASTGTL